MTIRKALTIGALTASAAVSILLYAILDAAAQASSKGWRE